VIRLDPDAYRSRLYVSARTPWEGQNALLKASLISVVANWAAVGSKDCSECPITYTDHEVRECLTLYGEQRDIGRGLEKPRSSFGLNRDGWVRSHEYDAAKKANEYLKAPQIADLEPDFDEKDIADYPLLDHDKNY
jgi:hypothetical protein